MSKCDWLLVTGRTPRGSDSYAMGKAIESTGRKVTHLTESEVYSKTLPKNPNTIVFGPIPVVEKLSRESDYISWLDLKAFQCTTYYSYWGGSLLNRDYALYPLGEIYRLHQTIFDIFGADFEGVRKIFIRPNASARVFDGGLYSKLELSSLMNTVDRSILAVVSSPKVIKDECRFFVIDREIKTFSQYFPERSQKTDGGPWMLAKQLARSPYPGLPSVYALDIATTEDNIVGLVEIGSINTSAWFEAAQRRLVELVSLEAERCLI